MTQPRSRGLGRGLEALIPMSREGGAMVPQMIAVDQIRPSRQQVRARFDAEPLGELADSIRLHGVLQPLLVRRHVDGYELIAGERRWRAARLAGLTSVPAVVRSDTGNDEQLVLGLIENLQRADLDPIEEARGLQRLTEEFGLTHEEVAQRIGKHRVSVTQSLRLLDRLPRGPVSRGRRRHHRRTRARARRARQRDRRRSTGSKVVLARQALGPADRELGRTYRPAPRADAASRPSFARWRRHRDDARSAGAHDAAQANRGRLEIRLLQPRRARTGLR